jgi:RimJ/RimL family protein N-acetyltransferase
MSHQTNRDSFSSGEEGHRRRFMIAGERVILRALETDDLDRCFRWMNDPQIVRTLKSRYPIPFFKEAEWLEGAVRSTDDERHFAIEKRDSREHIGNASIHAIDWVSRRAKFGLFIGEPSAWNKGFGGDAIRALVRFAFDDMNLAKLRIDIFEYNDRGRHLLESNGFVREGTLAREFYRDGAYHDIAVYSVFRDAPPRIPESTP